MGELYRIGRLIALSSVVISLLLAVMKITAGVKAHSTAVVADGIESAGDVIASGFVALALTLSARPPDEDHPYGHGRVETLMGLGVGALLSSTGALLCFRSLEKLGETPLTPAAFALWPLLISIAVKIATFATKRHFGRRLRSDSLQADAWNDGVDVLSGVVASVALVLAVEQPARFVRADEYGGFAVGLIVIVLSLRVIHDTSLQLMDTMPDQTMMNQIRQVARGVPGALDVEKCYARKSGLQYHVDLHLEVDAGMTVRESHNIATAVRSTVKEHLPWVADVLVHVEPHGS